MKDYIRTANAFAPMREEFIICHPVNYELLKLAAKTGGIPMGMEIRPNPYVPIFVSEWQFPKDWSSRWIDYEKSDETWAKPLGYGRQVETNERWFMVYRPPQSFGLMYSVS